MPERKKEFIKVHDPGHVGKYLSDRFLRKLAKRVVSLEAKVKYSETTKFCGFVSVVSHIDQPTFTRII